jgi:predicted ArsR family transcriptional regulator
MISAIDENPTRQNIITLLKKNKGMTIEELSKKVSITPMGIRQHLLSLEKKGLVSYTAKKRGVGRPGFVYALTETADNMFPKAYDRFSLDVLKEIRKYEGPSKISQIFNWRGEKLLQQRKDALSEFSGIDGTLHGLKNLLDKEGFLAELGKEGDRYILKTFNCPISKVATEFSDACVQEVRLYSDLLRRNVTLEQCMAQGNPVCVFSIPAV